MFMIPIDDQDKGSLEKKISNIDYRIDRHKVFPFKQFDIELTYIREIPPSHLHQLRSGVILYQIIDNEMIFTLGIDFIYNNITDFGGGVKYSDKSPIVGGLREFNEETLGIFGQISQDQIKNCAVIYSTEMMIIFVPFIHNINNIVNLFNKMKNTSVTNEIKSIVSIDRKRFSTMIEKNDDLVYHRVSNLLQKAKDKYDDFFKYL